MSADPRLRRAAAAAAAPPPPPAPPPETTTTNGTTTTESPKTNGVDGHDEDNGDKFTLRFCTVCASNQNR